VALFSARDVVPKYKVLLIDMADSDGITTISDIVMKIVVLIG